MQIKVKSLQGDEYIVDVQNGQLVSDLKACISEKANGLAVERLKLVYKGRTMQDKTLIGDYNLEEGSKVHLILQRDTLASLSTTAASAAGLGQISSSSSTSPDTLGNSRSNPSSSSPSYQSIDSTKPPESSRLQDDNDANDITNNATSESTRKNSQPHSRFEVILRERLALHFPPATVEKIMANLQHEINADINSSSLDDLERLAKQKLNISNE